MKRTHRSIVVLMGALAAGTAVAQVPGDADEVYTVRAAQAQAVRDTALERCTYQPAEAQAACTRQAESGYARALEHADAERARAGVQE